MWRQAWTGRYESFESFMRSVQRSAIRVLPSAVFTSVVNTRPSGFPAAVCASSVGVSTDELPDRVPPARRIYFFHPGPWTRAAYDAAVAQAGRWRR